MNKLHFHNLHYDTGENEGSLLTGSFKRARNIVKAAKCRIKEQNMEDNEEFVSKINRVPSEYKVKVRGEKKQRVHRALVRMSDVTIDEIEWLWEPYIPLGRLTLLGGDPGAGKSFITTALASALSKGEALPGELEIERAPMVTLLLNAEDDPADTIKPRLNNMHADQRLIFVSPLDIELDEKGLCTIEEMIDNSCAKLVIIDPIVAFLGVDMDMNRATDVRTVMKALARIARQKNIAIVIVRHNRKQPAGAKAGTAIYAGMGSIDFTASVRSELAVVENRQGTKFLNHIKANSGKKGLSIQYEIVSLADGSGVLNWLKLVSPLTPFGKGESKISTTPRGTDKVKAWLHDLLIQSPDGLPSEDVFSKALLAGFSQTKVNLAKKGVAVSVKNGTLWLWKVDPNASGPLDPEDADMVE